MVNDITVVTAGIPEKDDCKILTRLKAFIVSQGVCPTIEHVFRDRAGNPVDLSRWLASETSLSLSTSTSSSTPPAGTTKVRIKEWIDGSINPVRNPIWDIYGDAVDPVKGVLRYKLDPEVTERAGIYLLSFACLDEHGVPVAIDQGLLSVERSLFASNMIENHKDLGPPTIQEIRMRLMDSSASENMLLNDIEFNDEQLLQALTEPIRLWNETPPPIQTYSTRTFPFRGAWLSGVLAQLHMTIANHFRRNTYRSAAGGTNDKDKEREYMAEGTRLWAEYKAWLLNKKVEMNLKLFFGQAPSQYTSWTGW